MRSSLSRVATTIVVGLLVVACTSATSPPPAPSPLPTSAPPVTSPLPTSAPPVTTPLPTSAPPATIHPPTSSPPAPSRDSAQISAGYAHTCVLTSGGGVKCWGYGLHGALGNGTATTSRTPVSVAGLTSGVSAISAASFYACALTYGGGVMCWGWNRTGQLGNDTTTSSSIPVGVSGLTSGVTAISAGDGQNCALTSGGGVKCWGYTYSSGALGTALATISVVPVDVSGLESGVSAVAASGGNVCALTSGGGVKCWGFNGAGQLGNGTTTISVVPVDVSGLTSGVTAIAAGGGRTCALTSGGGVKCWGYNDHGQLGNGTTTNSSVPVDVSGLESGITAISTGRSHTCALTSGGGVKCWGFNGAGQLGTGTTTTSLVPVVVAGLTNGVTAISAGYGHTCALTSRSSVKCWGDNSYGQLGNGTRTNSKVPVEVDFASSSSAVWSEPTVVGSSGQCDAIAAVIDAEGGEHIAVGCDARIRYSVQTGTDWNTTELAPPNERAEYQPQLAVHGDVLYLAYTRVAIEDGGCGDSGRRDVGVYVRTRALPDGEWSDPELLGELADGLHSFRVVGGTIHATVKNADDGQIYYETLNGGSFRRYEIPYATGDVALRIGDDGKARIAYEADGAIWYGVFTGSGFASTEIEGSSNGYAPVLVLGAGDRPYLLWRRGYHGGGCAEPGPEPDDGTYYGTKVGGAWQSERLTPGQGVASLTVDVDAGRIHVLVSDQGGLVYRSKSEGEAWSTLTFSAVHASDAVIRRDPLTGALLVAYIRGESDGARVYVMQYR